MKCLIDTTPDKLFDDEPNPVKRMLLKLAFRHIFSGVIF